MKYFVAIEEELLLKLWLHDPSLVAPFSRPFFPRHAQSTPSDSSAVERDISLPSLHSASES